MDDELPDDVKYWINYSKKDCFFNVGPSSGPNEQIGAIKILLMAYSEPLRNMLEESDMAEKGEIYLPDIEPKSFKNFIKCVYGGSAVVLSYLNFEECAKLYYIAEKYLVAQVKQDVIQKMMKQLPFSINELFVAFKNIVCFQDKTLNTNLRNVLTRNTKEVFADKRFLDISKEALLIIVQQESLNVKEIDVFKAVVKWAKNKLGSQEGSVIREYISGLTQFIRFRVMSIQEFCVDVIPTDILTAEEACKMCTAIVSNEPHKLITFSNTTNLRCNEILNKKMRLESKLEYSCSVENITDNTYHCSGYTELGEYSWQFALRRLNDYLALHLYSKPSNDEPSWECNVSAELILVNQCDKEDFKKSLLHKYNKTNFGWGYPKFKVWADVVDPSKGFIKHGSIIVVSYITLI